MLTRNHPDVATGNNPLHSKHGKHAFIKFPQLFLTAIPIPIFDQDPVLTDSTVSKRHFPPNSFTRGRSQTSDCSESDAMGSSTKSRPVNGDCGTWNEAHGKTL